MAIPKQSDLTNVITSAARMAFSSLFQQHPGKYYYCSLITTGEAHSPVVAAWSEEALAAATAEMDDPNEAAAELKWSYADSPFYCYGEEFFQRVNELFQERPQLTYVETKEEWESEYQLRVDAMEAAMAQLDSEGIFGTGKDRLETVVLVEVMPPDSTNTERAKRLNPPEALTEWLEEAAE